MIRFGIVGCGRIAQKHAALCKQFGELIAVCDIAPEKAVALASKYGAKSYFSIDELLLNEKHLDVLVICTPNGLHPEQTIKGFENHLHVVCEKPMAIDSERARKMIDASLVAKKQLFIIKQNRFNPAVLAVRKLLKSGSLGNIYSVQLNAFWNRGPGYYKNSWHGKNDLDGGILFTQFSHFIDLLYWLFGDIEKVAAYSKNFHPEYEKEYDDNLVSCFEMQNGAIGTAHFTIDSFEVNMEGSLTVFAEHGTIKIGGRYLNDISYQSLKGGAIPEVETELKENNYGTYSGSMSNHDKVYSHIVEVLAGKAENQFPGEDGLKTVEIIQKIYQAAYETEHSPV